MGGQLVICSKVVLEVELCPIDIVCPGGLSTLSQALPLPMFYPVHVWPQAYWSFGCGTES
jgi:hypothetical protein